MENLGSDVRVNSFKFTLVSLQLSPIQLAQSCFCFFFNLLQIFFLQGCFSDYNKLSANPFKFVSFQCQGHQLLLWTD